ncbi:unnamed protein product [Protopolystoma xenopodis]|uniref:Uncharacterized protein n=1 Tax=Protopolystoma xenopodis TaxID=117903 RepID=A0A448WLN4_9PLAT|nr:unnamed protein product [Protopolystoma xenopodis]
MSMCSRIRFIATDWLYASVIAILVSLIRANPEVAGEVLSCLLQVLPAVQSPCLTKDVTSAPVSFIVPPFSPDSTRSCLQQTKPSYTSRTPGQSSSPHTADGPS